MKKICHNCKYGAFCDTDLEREAYSVRGQCRRHSPTGNHETYDKLIFPRVEGEDWCGDFELR